MDYSKLNRRFRSEKDCLDYLFSIRWSDGYYCPRCGCQEMWEVSPYKYKCRKCSYQTSVTAGTLFHHTHISLYQWFKAIWYMSLRGNKATAFELMEEVGIGSNRTALSMINKIKSEMFTTNEDIINRKLYGNVDICIIRKNNILVAAEVTKCRKGHIRLYRMPKYDKDHFRKFILENIESGSNIKREHRLWELVRPIEGYTFKTMYPERYEAPCAQEVYRNFLKYLKQQRMNGQKESALKIMKEYTQLVNSFTYDITFDGIIYNFLTYEPRKSSFKW